MADAPEGPDSTRLAVYINRLIAGDFDDKTKQEIADIFDIDRKTLWAWNKKVDWAYVTAEKRKLYAQDILEIDQAMLREGKKGNVPAAVFCHQRFDGWVPASKVLTEASDAELFEEAERIKAGLAGGNPGKAGADMPRTGTPEAT